MLDDVRYVKNGAIIGWNCGVAGEEEMDACLALQFGITEIVGVAIYIEYHVARIIREHRFFLCGQVMKEMLCFPHGVFGWLGEL